MYNLTQLARCPSCKNHVIVEPTEDNVRCPYCGARMRRNLPLAGLDNDYQEPLQAAPVDYQKIQRALPVADDDDNDSVPLVQPVEDADYEEVPEAMLTETS